MARLMDLSGQRFHRLTVVAYAGRKGAFHQWLCRCDCGRDVVKYGNHLRAGQAKSCGCQRRDSMRKLANEGRAGRPRLGNRYEVAGDVVIGYASNTGNPFFVDRNDWPRIRPYTWLENRSGYIETRVTYRPLERPRRVFLHRFILGVHGDAPANLSGAVTDHINGNRRDNRRANLRVVSNSENQMNRRPRKDNRSGHTGVSWDAKSRKWRAYINYRGRKLHLGFHGTLDAAVAARRAAESLYYR